MKHAHPFVPLLVALLAATAQAAVAPYTLGWWAHGLRAEPVDGQRLFYIQTSHYRAAFDVNHATLTGLDAVQDPLPYGDAVAQSQAPFDALPAAALQSAITLDGTTYTCIRAAAKTDDHTNYPVRLIEGGQFLHHIDILGLEFADADGKRLDVDARLEIAAWPQLWHAALIVTPINATGDAQLTLTCTRDGQAAIRSEEKVTLRAGRAASVRLTWRSPDAPGPLDDLTATDPRAENAPLPNHLDPILGAHVVELPARQWPMAEDLDRLDRYPVTLRNATDTAQTYPLVFSMEGPFQGVTGLCPMLRDAQGNPTGIPVQISKNWHRQPDQRLRYEGPWFHGITEITVPAGETWTGEFAITYARWGGVPAASHAQLCLIGWGGNQRWDQAAIGSFGESICYDPNIGLNRSMIDDVRPLMVRSMNDGQWEWDHNVGGGDFLVYFDPAGARQYLAPIRTAYLSQGPNLTDVVYAGQSADGKIDARIEVFTPRTDDLNRAYHRIRYDVRETMPFSRLAFYQVGADHYNDHQFTTLSRGNADGLTETWEAKRGGKQYHRAPMAVEGESPWIALTGGIRPKTWDKGAWADRGLVVRNWQARLGGQDVPHPWFNTYGTENGPPSANAELVPPPGCTELLPGDFVEADLELLIVPQSAEDYYGPNAALRASLQEHGGSWQPIHRLAQANNAIVTAQLGTITRTLPVQIQVDASSQSAALTLTGGTGHYPLSFTGLHSATGYTLTINGAPVNQAVHGNDYWQTQFDPATHTYTQTYNVPLDGEPREKVITIQPKE